MQIFLLLYPLFGEGGDYEGGDGTNHNPLEETDIADMLLNVSRHHARKHHAKCHKSGAKGVVCSGVFALTELQHKTG